MEFSSETTMGREEQVKKEIEKIAISMSKEYEDCAIGEKQNVKRQLDNFNSNVEQLFAKYMGVVPDRVLNNLKEQIEAKILSIINKSRVSERNGTITRLADTRADNLEEMTSKIKSFKNEGVSKDDNFETKMEEIAKRIEVAYRKVLLQRPNRNSEMALEEIISEAKKLKNNFIAVNEGKTKEIETNLIRRITEIETSLSERERPASDFSSKMQSGVNSPETIAEYYQNELEDREETSDPKRDYGAMFKS